MKGGNAMKRLFAITTIVALCSVLFFVVVCVAGPPKTITTEGKWSGTTTPGGPCAGVFGFKASSVGTGVLSHLGLTTWEGDEMCLIALGPAVVPWPYAPVFQGYGTATITTATGEEIWLNTHFTFIGVPGVPGSDFLWAQDIDVANGTGRFENAIGHVHSTGIGKSNIDGTGSWEGTSSGTITY